MRSYLVVMLGLGCAGLVAGCRGNGERPSGTLVQLERLSFELPPGWRQEPPSSTMRVAQAAIPGPAGEAELAVFFFGVGQGGDIEANLQRWMNQVVAEPGSDPQRETFESGGLRVTWVDVRGTLKPGQLGMGPATLQPNSRLLGAVIEGDGGPWFLKVTGPEATLAPQRAAFLALLHSATLR